MSASYSDFARSEATALSSSRGFMNRKSARIPRSKLRGMRANLKMEHFLTVEDSLQLAAGSFNLVKWGE